VYAVWTPPGRPPALGVAPRGIHRPSTGPPPLPPGQTSVVHRIHNTYDDDETTKDLHFSENEGLGQTDPGIDPAPIEGQVLHNSTNRLGS